MPNIRGLSDLKEEDEERGKNNDYYAGGEKSGQLIRGAPDEDDEDNVESFFTKARQVGARSGSESDLPSQTFRGTARNLAGETKEAPRTPLNRVITFYSNGFFTVDNGPARHITDPANLDFIASISKGQLPRELEVGPSEGPVTVNLIRREEPYVPPKAPTTFTGAARTLRSSSSSAAAGCSSSAASQEAAAADADDGGAAWRGVDESQPTTTLQLRLPDGARRVAKFNRRHTVRDVRRFLRAEAGDAVGSGFQLVAPPNRPLSGDVLDKTLEDADLLNAVIIVKP